MTLRVIINGPVDDKSEGGPIWVIDVVDASKGWMKSFKTPPQKLSNDEILNAIPSAVSTILKEVMKEQLCQPH